MGQDERLNRKKTVEKAGAALDKTVECINAVNRQATQIESLKRRILDLEQSRTTLDDRLNAQGLMISNVEQKSAEARGELLHVLLRRLERFETLGFWARARWVLFGTFAPLDCGLWTEPAFPPVSDKES